MRKTGLILMVLAVFGMTNARAAEDISGIWEGKLEMAPGSALTVQFKIKQADDGSYTALVNSPDQGGLKNIPASGVVYEGNILKIEVAEVSGSFEGSVKDRAIDGKWSQPGTTLPLNLRPYQEPTLSPEYIDLLMGRWQGKLDSPVADFTMVFRFEKSDSGDLVGFLDVPAQAAQDIPISDIIMVDGSLTLKIKLAMSEYKATWSGTEFEGKWIQGGQEIPLVLRKGGTAPIDRLTLSKASFDRLAGPWNGELAIPQGPLKAITVVLRFEKTAQDDMIGFMDAPDQGRSGLPITEASLEGGIFNFKIAGAQVEYKGQLSEEGMIGEWKQMGRGLPLTLKKGKAQIEKLTLSPAAVEQLSGKWEGRVDTPQGTLRVVFRFERTEEGDVIGYADSPDQGSTNVPISEAQLEDGDFTLKVSGLMVEYKGRLSGDTIAGQLTQGGKSYDVPMRRAK